jgi:hypothetical protein
MRSGITAVLGVGIALSAGLFGSAAADDCRISDSALCLANPNCHWDVDKRGCEPGPLQAQDACTSHSDKGVCESDSTLGCKWSAEKNICQSKAD